MADSGSGSPYGRSYGEFLERDGLGKATGTKLVKVLVVGIACVMMTIFLVSLSFNIFWGARIIGSDPYISPNNEVELIIGENDQILYVSPGVLHSSKRKNHSVLLLEGGGASVFFASNFSKFKIDLKKKRWVRKPKVEYPDYKGDSPTRFGICHNLKNRAVLRENPCNLTVGNYTWALAVDSKAAGSYYFVVGKFENGFEWGIKHIYLANNRELVAAGELNVKSHAPTDSIEWNFASGSYMRQLVSDYSVNNGWGEIDADATDCDTDMRRKELLYKFFVPEMQRYWQHIAGHCYDRFKVLLVEDQTIIGGDTIYTEQEILNSAPSAVPTKEEAVKFCREKASEMNYKCSVYLKESDMGRKDRRLYKRNRKPLYSLPELYGKPQGNRVWGKDACKYYFK